MKIKNHWTNYLLGINLGLDELFVYSSYFILIIYTIITIAPKTPFIIHIFVNETRKRKEGKVRGAVSRQQPEI